MKPQLAAVALCAALLAAPAVARDDRPMTADEVLDLARGQTVWCENYSEETRDCEGLYMLRQEADGTLVSSAMFLLTEQPRLTFMIAEVVELRGDQLCSSGSVDDLNIRASLEGEPAPETMNLAIRQIFAESMAPYADKTMCQRLLATDDPAVLHEEITADGERLPDFETTYRLGDFDSGFLLRPMVEPEAEGQVAL